MEGFGYQQEQMLRLIASRGVSNERVLDAMRRVPRHLFVGPHLAAQAYGDFALPIGSGQTISQPYVVARMTELLDPGPDDTVLEIGTGSGYQTAILAHLARRVYSIERYPELAQAAVRRLRELGLQNVKIQVFDGSRGWSEAAPYERILITAAAPSVPAPILEQLAEGGRLVVPEGERSAQRLVIYERGKRGIRKRAGEPVTFVPLIGRYGFTDPESDD